MLTPNDPKRLAVRAPACRLIPEDVFESIKPFKYEYWLIPVDILESVKPFE